GRAAPAELEVEPLDVVVAVVREPARAGRPRERLLERMSQPPREGGRVVQLVEPRLLEDPPSQARLSVVDEDRVVGPDLHGVVGQILEDVVADVEAEDDDVRRQREVAVLEGRELVTRGPTGAAAVDDSRRRATRGEL